QRDSAQATYTPREAAYALHQAAKDDLKTGIMFGPEAKGLNNDDTVLSDAILAVPLNPAFKSLNLAQAVFCIGYEWFQASLGDTDEDRKSILDTPQEERTRRASKKDLVHMFEHLETELDDCGFLRPPEKRPAMVRNIRAMFQRANMTDQEVRTMRGIISGLTRKHLRRK
ncbi:MAG: RNA methyltransferase, partial [Rhodospirillales bacterium]|nr:RNA methyltransferase [Rhodospirillales bacterium]